MTFLDFDGNVVFTSDRSVGFNNITFATNTNGEFTAPLPDFRARNQSAAQESRQFQPGVKFIF